MQATRFSLKTARCGGCDSLVHADFHHEMLDRGYNGHVMHAFYGKTSGKSESI